MKRRKRRALSASLSNRCDSISEFGLKPRPDSAYSRRHGKIQNISNRPRLSRRNNGPSRFGRGGRRGDRPRSQGGLAAGNHVEACRWLLQKREAQRLSRAERRRAEEDHSCVNGSAARSRDHRDTNCIVAVEHRSSDINNQSNLTKAHLRDLGVLRA